MAIGGSNPISKHIDDILKDENRRMPAAELPREEKDSPAAAGDELEIDDQSEEEGEGPETDDR